MKVSTAREQLIRRILNVTFCKVFYFVSFGSTKCLGKKQACYKQIYKQIFFSSNVFSRVSVSFVVKMFSYFSGLTVLQEYPKITVGRTESEVTDLQIRSKMSVIHEHRPMKLSVHTC